MKKRIFTAIDISSNARAEVFNYIENLRTKFSSIRVGWEKPEKLHLTLKFLGDVEENQLQNVFAAVEKTAGQTREFDLQIAAAGVFPSIQKAKILWLGVRDEQGSLTKINDVLETECERIGFTREKRKFNPHLTVARLREPDKSAEITKVHCGNKFSTEVFPVKELIVYQSQFLPNSSRYTPIFQSRLINRDF